MWRVGKRLQPGSQPKTQLGGEGRKSTSSRRSIKGPECARPTEAILQMPQASGILHRMWGAVWGGDPTGLPSGQRTAQLPPLYVAQSESLLRQIEAEASPSFLPSRLCWRSSLKAVLFCLKESFGSRFSRCFGAGRRRLVRRCPLISFHVLCEALCASGGTIFQKC